MEYDLQAIQRRRKVLELTQHQLATQAQVSQSLIAKIENGSLNDITYSTALRILGALDKAEHKNEKTAADIMTAKVLTAEVSDLVKDKVKQMKEKGISQMPVLWKQWKIISVRYVIVGLLSEQAIIENFGKINSKTKVEDIMLDAPPQVPEDAPLSVIAGLLKSKSCVLVTKRGEIVGIITKTDLI
ncbi:MAG: CBS domain-containing protein [DPANN group archaeon]|nr:CBS domain-containing protein [DPANN group archaeon]